MGSGAYGLAIYSGRKSMYIQEVDKDVKLFRFNKIDLVPRKYTATRESDEPVCIEN
jgi:hypothetical protein